MNRTDRLYAIREELRRAGSRGRTAEQLAATFEVSIRTIKRDISALQAGGFPAWARTGRAGGYVVDAEATLPPVNLTPSEVSGLAVLLATHDGHPFAAHARAALTKVLAVTPPNVRERAERLASRVWIDHQDPQPPVDAGLRRAVEEALATGLVLSMNYRDQAGAETRRRVEPQLLASTGGYWYLIAYCLDRQAMRWFRLDRILVARLTRQTSHDRPVSEIGSPPPTARPATPR
ncbi:helix-turn-helix transcriptional regulator [Protaetiibacter larvae]|uniref:WYL domain-containing protein n=1 Tax=Protaetiibacter larvae TaxID=2592654 RepID=A0A5C1Y7F8_9MICO|nr:WYL domain-containing protein [Protaetiibacter larvae]QEO09751.1 WYL domain-containing protein [Protaetiibacter larvae]